MLKKQVNLPTPVLTKIGFPVYQIIQWFTLKCLDILKYYRCAHNLYEVKKQLIYQMRYSLFMTLAVKHRCSVKKIITLYGEDPAVYVVANTLHTKFDQIRNIIAYPSRNFISILSRQYLKSIKLLDLESIKNLNKTLNFYKLL
jgi:hypothetical protein